MLISDLLIPEQINLNLLADNRLSAIKEVVDLLQVNPKILHFKEFYEELLAREKIESTYLGNEVAFPHVRTDHLREMVLAIGRSTKGIPFENSGKPVRLIFVIGTPKRMATDYLSVVGGLARLIKAASVRKKLFQAATAEDVIEIITSAEKGGES